MESSLMPDTFARLIALEDAIEDSPILDDYGKFLSDFFRFLENEIAPIAPHPARMRHLVACARAFVAGNFSAEDLREEWSRYESTCVPNRIDDPHGYHCAIEACWCADIDLLNNHAPVEQQDSYTSYILSGLFEITQDLSLCEKLYLYLS